jgi:hypothetical protein
MTTALDNVDNYMQILSPLVPLFSFTQLETLLCAWVPHRLDTVLDRHGLKSGLYVVDHFIVTATIALLLVSAKFIVTYCNSRWIRGRQRSESHDHTISVTIQPFITDSYHNS